MAELAWNDLPKKITVGVAALVGLTFGAGLTVLIASTERSDAKLEAELAQRQAAELQQYVDHWRQTAGFELDQYRGDPVVRLEPGQEFVSFVPSVGARTAGNLWKINEE